MSWRDILGDVIRRVVHAIALVVIAATADVGLTDGVVGPAVGRALLGL